MLRQSVGKIVATVQEKERLLTEDWQHSLFNVYLSRGKANVANPQTLCLIVEKTETKIFKP